MKQNNETGADGDNSLHVSTQEESLRWYDWPALILIFVLAVVVFAQFFTRYVLNDSWAWTEEISRYLLIGVVFSGCVSVMLRREHIRLEAVETWVQPQNVRPMRLFVGGLSFIYYAFLAVAAIVLASQSTQNLVSIALPKAVVYGFVAVCLVVCALASLPGVTALFDKRTHSE